MRYFILLITSLALSGTINAGPLNLQRVIFSADVVASTCHVRVDADGSGNNVLTFATFNKSSATAVPPREFIIRMYESGATLAGCSAFLAGRLASVQFGNPGQLDAGGVVTHGAGEGVRIAVQAVDPQADWRGPLSASRDRVNYPAAFAAQGQLRFSAQPQFPTTVNAGEYSGALAFVVTYQ